MNWNEIEKELKEIKPNQSARAKDEFWDDFKARAELVNQDGELDGVNSYNPGWVRWAVVLSCIIIVIALAFNIQSNSTPAGTIAEDDDEPKKEVVAKNEILELDILASNDGCDIMSYEDTTVIMIYAPEDE